MNIENIKNLSNDFLSSMWWILTFPVKIVDFFSTPTHHYPDDEVGLLMRSYMGHQSWFDRISFWWFEKSIFIKIIFFLGATMLSAYLGALIGATTFFVLGTCFFLMLSNLLLGFHETSRIDGAALIAKERITLSKDLKAAQELMEMATAESNKEADSLRHQADAVIIVIDNMDTQTNSITQNNELLSRAVDSISRETIALTEQERLVTSQFSDISLDLSNYKSAISLSKNNINVFAEEFSELISSIKFVKQKNKEQVTSVNQNNFFFTKEEISNSKNQLKLEQDILVSVMETNDKAEELLKLMGFWQPEIKI